MKAVMVEKVVKIKEEVVGAEEVVVVLKEELLQFR